MGPSEKTAIQDVAVPIDLAFEGCGSRSAQKLRAHQRAASGAARRLVECRPVDYVPADAADRDAFEALGPLARRAPRTQEELIQYVSWAAPRARKLGTRVSPAELRSIGFIHALWVEAQLRDEREAAQAVAGAKLAGAVTAGALLLATVAAALAELGA